MRLLEVITLSEKICRSQSTNQPGERNKYHTDLCFAICWYFQVVFINLSDLTHNFFFYFQYFLVIIWFLYLMGRTAQRYIRSFVFRFSITCHAIWERWNKECNIFTTETWKCELITFCATMVTLVPSLCLPPPPPPHTHTLNASVLG